MDSSFTVVEGGAISNTLLGAIVYAVRVINQSIGVQYENNWSENHVVVYLLLGTGSNGKVSIRFDMRPNPDTGPNEVIAGQSYLPSSLYLKLQRYVASRDSLAIIDFYTELCSQNPEDMQLRIGTATQPTVRRFLDAVTANDSGVRYYFANLPNAGPAGCRHIWSTVLDYFHRVGLLPRTQFNQVRTQQLHAMLRKRYHKNDSGEIVSSWTNIVPGIWTATMDRNQLRSQHPLLRYLDESAKSILESLRNAFAVSKPATSENFGRALHLYDRDPAGAQRYIALAVGGDIEAATVGEDGGGENEEEDDIETEHTTIWWGVRNAAGGQEYYQYRVSEAGERTLVSRQAHPPRNTEVRIGNQWYIHDGRQWHQSSTRLS